MRAASTIFAAVFMTVLSCRGGFSQTACLEEGRQDSVLRAVRERSSLARGLPLRASMIPRLTDTVIIFKTEHMQDPMNAQVPVFAFYAVTPAFFKLEGSRVAGVTVELDDASEWLVAVDCRSDQVYVLEGSSGAVGEFNSLIKQIGVRVTSAEIATDVFSFFSKVVYGERFQSQIISDDMYLESLALQDFRLRVPTEKKRGTFESWWRGVSAATKKALAPPQTIRSKDGFAVQYFYYRRGNIYRAGLTVKADGTVVEGKSVLLTPRGM